MHIVSTCAPWCVENIAGTVTLQNNDKLPPFCVCFSGLNDGSPLSGYSVQSQSSLDFPAPGQGEPFHTPKTNSPFPETDILNPFNSSAGI